MSTRSVLALASALSLSLLPALSVHPAYAKPLQSGTPSRSSGIVSPELAERLKTMERARTKSERAAAITIPVEIVSDRDVAREVQSIGGHIEANVVGKVLAAVVPVARIRRVAGLSGVKEVYSSNRMRASLDISVPEILAPQAWALTGPSGLPVKGRHVLVGVVDSGIDYRNPDFRNPDGSTRIRAIWDQTQDGRAPNGFDFGYLCDSASINAGTCPERDTDGHGTHVAGIAAGNGLSSHPAREIGVAPEADLLVVKSNLQTDKIIAAWKYLINTAHALREPLVINNSFGDDLSPHDGSSPDSMAADALGGPGVVFVAAAGNEGSKGLHASGSMSGGSTTSLVVNAHGGGNEAQMAMYYPPVDSAAVTLTDTATGETFGPVAEGSSISDRSDRSGRFKISIDATDPDSRHHGAYVDILTSDSSQDLAGSWRLDIAGRTVRDNGKFNAWLDSGGTSVNFSNPDELDTIGDPADATGVIAVGNYATRTHWVDRNSQGHDVCDVYICTNGTLAVGDIKASSSRGPTADGRQKPDISAPGTMIISSLSADAAICSSSNTDNCIDPAQITPDGKNYVESGTSMSSPHVAGVVALMLQVNPTITPALADSIVRSTARHDQFTGTASWTPTFGAGKVDAYASVLGAEHATTLPRSTPAPLPTPASGPRASATPVPAASFHIVAVRVDRKASGSSWRLLQMTQRFPVKTALVLSIYSQSDRSAKDVLVSVQWKIARGTKRIYAHSSLRQGETTSVNWDHVKFTPTRTGKYTFTATVRMGSTTQQHKIAFQITGKP